MKVSFIELFIFQLLFNILYCSAMNSRKSQLEYKRNKKHTSNIVFKKQKENKEIKKLKRKLVDEDDGDEELTDSVYTRCDNGHTPDDISDCTTHETAESSCCLFTYGQDTGCVLIGFKYLGSKTVGDMVVNCKSDNIKIYSFLLIIMSLMLLI